MYTGKELVEKSIITGFILGENIQQHGIDLNLDKVEVILQGGEIPLIGKTKLGLRKEINVNEENRFLLTPGVYELTFKQGCKIPSDCRGEIIQRSSLSRNGAFIRSAIFDAGFETEKMGTIIVLHLPLVIEKGARVAQFTTVISNEVNSTDLYSGQWQGDKQRTK